MGADEEVRQYSCSAAAPGAVAPKRLAGEKQRGPRYLDPINPDIGEDSVSFLYSRVHDQADHLLVIAKAIGLSWETVRAILVMRAPNDSEAGRSIGRHHSSFLKLRQSTAMSALQFYRLRARAEAQLETLA
jgi:hypothetical protein